MNRKSVLIVSFMFLIFIGCSRQQPAQKSFDWAGALSQVPPQVSLVVAWAGNPLWGETGLFASHDVQAVKGLRAKLDQYLGDNLGVNFYEGKDGVAFLAFPSEVALVMTVPSKGPLRGETLEEHRGVQLYKLKSEKPLAAALSGNKFFVGTPSGVKMAVGVSQGDPSLAAQAEYLKPAMQWSDQQPGQFALLLPIQGSMLASFLPMVQQYQLQSLVAKASLKGDISLAVHGLEAKKLGELRDLALKAIEKQMAQFKEKQQRLVDEGDVLLASSAMIFQQFTTGAWNFDKLAVKGNILSYSKEAPKAAYANTAMYGMLGVTAAVAIPAFLKYRKKAEAAKIRREAPAFEPPPVE